MKKVSIIKNGQVAYACEGTQEQIDRWFAKHSKKFGNPGGYRAEEVVLEPLVLDEMGNVLKEEVREVRNVWYEPDYKMVEEDLTALHEAEKVKQEKKALLIKELFEMDEESWKNINTIAECKVVLRKLVDILKDT